MGLSRLRDAIPLLVAVALAATILSPLLAGIEPVSGDPDRIYRPIKVELADALAQGRLPFWSERFGLGVPLVAESHAAAFYPPNLLLYRFLDVSTAYRLAMWLHNLVLVATTYAYARRLSLSPWGSALAALTFTFCGIQAIHSSHEWTYHVIPFLPLALLLADVYADTGRLATLALLSLVLGVQWTLGHFQVQTWTNLLVVFTGLWRVAAADRRRWARVLGLGAAPIWGGLIAAVQLGPSWELARFVGQMRRSVTELSFYSFPPAHWAELAIPRLFRGLAGGPEDPYWLFQRTTGFEACVYVGTLPLILVAIGLAGGSRDQRLGLWRLLVPATFALACMPRWWPEGYAIVLQLPGLGYFRCPARYLLVTSLGLALLAGHGFDRSIARGPWGIGLILALGFGLASFVWGWWWTELPALRGSFEREPHLLRLGPAALAWGIALLVLLAWRRGRLPDGAILVVTGLELGILYYTMTTDWGRSIALPSASPILERLMREPGVARVAGSTGDLPIRAGMTTGSPYVGFALPPPHQILEAAGGRQVVGDVSAARWLARFGVTHMIWDEPIGEIPGGRVVLRGSDPALDRLAYRPFGAAPRRTWRIVRLPDSFPAAIAAVRVVSAPDRRALVAALSAADARDQAWYLPADLPRDGGLPRARSARVERWDGHEAVVAHDGTCDLVIARTYYPGWTARVDDQPARAIRPANGGMQAVRLDGAGPSRVTTAYRPTGLGIAAAVSLASLGAAALVLARGAVGRVGAK